MAIRATDFNRVRSRTFARPLEFPSIQPRRWPIKRLAMLSGILLLVASGRWALPTTSGHNGAARHVIVESGGALAAPVRPEVIAMARGAAPAVVILGANESVEGLLVRSDIVRADAAKAGSLIAAAVFPGQIPAGTPLTISTWPMGTTRPIGTVPGRMLDEVSLRANLDLALTVRRTTSGLISEARPIAVDATPLNVAGTVGATLPASLRAAGTPARMVPVVLAALGKHVRLTSGLAPGDRFELVIARQTAADGIVETGDLLYAAVWRGAAPLIELVQWGSEPELVAVPALRRSTAWAGSALPVSGRLTSGYGLRFHPILGYTRMHSGVDIGAPWGAPIVAAMPGTVSFAGWHGGHGNYIRVDHGSGLSTGYAHLSRIGVVAGERVRGGEVIGNVGSTGLSTGPHLHYEMFRNGRAVDPLRSVGRAAGSGHALPGREPQRLAAAIASLRSLVIMPAAQPAAGSPQTPSGYR